MENPLFFAMTAAEFRLFPSFSQPIGWMACHFSAYGTGLSNFPAALPKGSLLILNDRMPLSRHDPILIAAQLQSAVEKWDCCGILLDLQRSGAEDVVQAVAALPCPVAVTPLYAKHCERAVFLPPPPLTCPLIQHLSPWKNREIWLEAALEQGCFRVRESGCQEIASAPIPCPHTDENLHCRYGIEIGEDFADFHLLRDRAQLDALLQEAAAQGVTRFVGLYQQLGQAFEWRCNDMG